MFNLLAINWLQETNRIVMTIEGEMVLTASLTSRFQCFEYHHQSAQKAYLFQILLIDMFSFSCFVSVRS